MGLKLLIIGGIQFKKSTIESLLDESRKIFDAVLFVPVNKIKVVSSKGKSKLFYKNIDLLEEFDACYPRFRPRDFFISETVLRILEQSDIYMPVSLEGYRVTNHKYFTIKKVANAGCPVVPSSLFISPEAAKSHAKDFGFPLVAKLLSGYAGKGVVLIRDMKQFESILQTVHIFDEFISVQKYIETGGMDLRCYVFGEKVVAVKRTGVEEDFRANISRGGSAEIIEASEQMKDVSLKAAKALNMEICAVDFIETASGPAIIEVNFMPGPFKKFLGNTVARESAEYIYNRVIKHQLAET